MVYSASRGTEHAGMTLRPGIENTPIGISPLVDFAFKLMLASRGHERVTYVS